MRNNIISAIFSISLIFLGSCRVKRDEGLVKQFRLNGINGIATYHIDRGEVLTVQKDEYMQLAEYMIQIDKDTVVLGNKFIGRFAVPKPNFKISIEEPRMETIEGAFKEPGSESKKFVFTTERLGTFSFKGQLEYDTFVVPFVYRFIVIPKQ